MKETNCIYHYCTLATFLEIIKNKTLRLSNITKSNDSEEMKYVLSCAENILCELILPDLKIEIAKEHLKKLIHSFFKMQIEYYDECLTISHAMCFSKDKDSLSQWRGYGDDSKGVAISFDRSVLEGYLKNSSFIKIIDVIYAESTSSQPELVANLKEIIMLTRAELRTPYNLCGNCEATVKLICDEVASVLFLEDALKYKNPAFKEENEVRIHTQVPKSHFGLKTSPQIDMFLEELQASISPLTVEYGLNSKSDKLVSYFDINFNHPESSVLPHNLINGVIIGSKAKISITELENIMWQYNFGSCIGNIEKSAASYR